ncbi:hypothetical protein TNCV_3672861 [Trichonephila clavipes]|nr:hypothetical protein TNCV_3672861 [Trichonephila clavipes]
MSKSTNAQDIRRLPLTDENTEKVSAADRVYQHIVSRMLNADQSADEVKRSSLAELKDMTKNGCQKYFDDLYKP